MIEILFEPIFNIKISDNDYTHRVINWNTKTNNNKIPSASLVLDNGDNVLTNYGDFGDGSSVVIKVAPNKDAGVDADNMATVFSGSVADVKFSSSNGKDILTITASGAGPMMNMRLSPCQKVVGVLDDISEVFKGTSTDSFGDAWSADTKGNYPNGLLYKTGYTYNTDSVTHIFDEGDYDVPTSFVRSTNIVSTAIKNICDKYGLLYWFIDGSSPSLLVKRAPTLDEDSFTHVDFTIGRGYSISQSDSVNYLYTFDKVTVVGANDMSYTLGSGTYEFVDSDDELVSLEDVYNQCDLYYNMKVLNDSEAISIICPPLLGYPVDNGGTYEYRSLLGKNITLDFNNIPSEDGDVVGVEHSYSASGWFTTVRCNGVKVTSTVALSEVKDELMAMDTTMGYNYGTYTPTSISKYVKGTYSDVGGVAIDNPAGFVVFDSSTSGDYDVNSIFPINESYVDGDIHMVSGNVYCQDGRLYRIGLINNTEINPGDTITTIDYDRTILYPAQLPSNSSEYYTYLPFGVAYLNNEWPTNINSGYITLQSGDTEYIISMQKFHQLSKYGFENASSGVSLEDLGPIPDPSDSTWSMELFEAMGDGIKSLSKYNIYGVRNKDVFPPKETGGNNYYRLSAMMEFDPGISRDKFESHEGTFKLYLGGSCTYEEFDSYGSTHSTGTSVFVIYIYNYSTETWDTLWDETDPSVDITLSYEVDIFTGNIGFGSSYDIDLEKYADPDTDDSKFNICISTTQTETSSLCYGIDFDLMFSYINGIIYVNKEAFKVALDITDGYQTYASCERYGDNWETQMYYEILIDLPEDVTELSSMYGVYSDYDIDTGAEYEQISNTGTNWIEVNPDGRHRWHIYNDGSGNKLRAISARQNCWLEGLVERIQSGEPVGVSIAKTVYTWDEDINALDTRINFTSGQFKLYYDNITNYLGRGRISILNDENLPPPFTDLKMNINYMALGYDTTVADYPTALNPKTIVSCVGAMPDASTSRVDKGVDNAQGISITMNLDYGVATSNGGDINSIYEVGEGDINGVGFDGASE